MTSLGGWICKLEIIVTTKQPSTSGLSEQQQQQEQTPGHARAR